MAPNVAMFTNQYVDGSFAVGKTNEYGNPSDVFTFTAEIWDEASSSYIPLSNANYYISAF